jgi:hypothetical protein
MLARHLSYKLIRPGKSIWPVEAMTRTDLISKMGALEEFQH